MVKPGASLHFSHPPLPIPLPIFPSSHASYPSSHPFRPFPGLPWLTPKKNGVFFRIARHLVAFLRLMFSNRNRGHRWRPQVSTYGVCWCLSMFFGLYKRTDTHVLLFNETHVVWFSNMFRNVLCIRRMKRERRETWNYVELVSRVYSVSL